MLCTRRCGLRKGVGRVSRPLLRASNFSSFLSFLKKEEPNLSTQCCNVAQRRNEAETSAVRFENNQRTGGSQAMCKNRTEPRQMQANEQWQLIVRAMKNTHLKNDASSGNSVYISALMMANSSTDTGKVVRYVASNELEGFRSGSEPTSEEPLV